MSKGSLIETFGARLGKDLPRLQAAGAHTTGEE
jgi:hypothetical protein